MLLFPHLSNDVYVHTLAYAWTCIISTTGHELITIFMNCRSETYWCVSTSTNRQIPLAVSSCFSSHHLLGHSNPSSWIHFISSLFQSCDEQKQMERESLRSTQCKYFHLSIPQFIHMHEAINTHIFELKLSLSDKRCNLTSSIFPRIVSWKMLQCTSYAYVELRVCVCVFVCRYARWEWKVAYTYHISSL